MNESVNEFEIIKKYFVKLTKKKYSMGLQDDCAMVNCIDNTKFIINMDSIAENTHFFTNDPPKSIANKLLGTNLSDLASMGALPLYWTFSFGASKKFINHAWLKEFSNEIAKLQNKYGFYLVGGDSISTEQLVLTCNMVGFIPKNAKPLLQNKAKEGDIICVSNNIGDSYWGLQLLLNSESQNFINMSMNHRAKLINSYHYVNPQVKLGNLLLNLANSCTDISDGLIVDLEKIMNRSNVSGYINLENIPFSMEVEAIHKINPKNILHSIAGGDDYQLVFSIPEHKLKKLHSKLINLGLQNKIKVTAIGKITSKNVTQSLDKLEGSNTQSNLVILHYGKNVYLKKKGFQHS